MAEVSLGNDSPEDPYQETDQDEPMDTDSELENDSRDDDLLETDRAPDTDSVQMEISDNDGSDEDVPEVDHLKQTLNEASQNRLKSAANGDVNHKILFNPGYGVEHGNMMEMSPTNANRVQRNSNYAIQDIHDLQEPIYGLPITLWQKVFLAVPPISLGRLLMCTRLFHAILAPQSPIELAFQQKFQKDVDFIPGNSIWQTSRARFAPGLSRPLNDKSELDMWRLLRGRTCEVCQQRKPLMTSYNTTDPWQSGPGSDGIRIIWPCGIRICGTCLIQRCQQVSCCVPFSIII